MFEFEGSLKNILSSLGLAILIVAMTMGMYAKIFLGIMTFNQYMMILGTVLLFPYKKTFAIINIPTIFKGFLAFWLLVFIYMFSYSSYSGSDLVPNALIVITTISLGLTVCDEDISISNVVRFVWILSLICAVLTIVFIRLGLYVIYTTYDPTIYGEEPIYDNLTAAQGGVMNLYAALFLFMRCNKKWEKLLLLAGLLLGLYSILLTQKRTPVIVICFVIFYYLYNKNLLRKIFEPKYLLIAVSALLGLIISSAMLADTFELVSNIQNSIVSGVSDLIFGVEYDSTNSAAVRVHTRDVVFERISNFDFVESILGAGYKTAWIDMPLVQSYQDLGILGFCLFAYFQFIFPAKILRRPSYMSDELMWAAFMVCYGLLGCLTTGHPYTINKWLPILVLACVYSSEQRREEYTYYDGI